MKKQCIVCGKEIETKNALNSCSPECRRERINRRKRVAVKKYRDENVQKYREYRRKHYAENREKINKTRAKYRNKKRSKINETKRKYYKFRYLNDPEYRVRVLELNKRERKWRKHLYPLLVQQNNICAIGGSKLPDDPKDCHVDHIIPRSKGGSDELSNLQIACWKCNILKSDKILEESHVR